MDYSQACSEIKINNNCCHRTIINLCCKPKRISFPHPVVIDDTDKLLS